MKHVLYALFGAPEDAQAALRELELAGLGQSICRVVVHHDRLNLNDLRQSEIDTRGAILRGLFAGSCVGAVLGAVLGLWHFTFLGLDPLSLAALSAALGAVFGTLGAALSGSGEPNRQFAALARDLREGRVLFTAEVEGIMAQAQVEQIFSKQGAIETARAAV